LTKSERAFSERGAMLLGRKKGNESYLSEEGEDAELLGRKRGRHGAFLLSRRKSFLKGVVRRSRHEAPREKKCKASMSSSRLSSEGKARKSG